ncbi:MAG: large-conductance mechanosensitive channel protein MscL [Hoylesella marshii]|uniref:Large-conductance mechanosensitive channel n=1 Tax=Hoylesella marshii DSM 16973 = JCM 13450 TaxID=862515 RepID=E0NPX1_9BACT|nr:large-conductance mechanosensitive channel protein MscL [Hoylesella marshii]EFM02847.1 large conductance mechanosensitive channel protein [Hoylesella marshii DSM 16973 = JCM 13450]
MNNFLNEFKAFAMRGNVMDMAVGVIIGGAFGKIVSSMVDDILMPIIGVLTGGIDFKELAITIGAANIKYGMFIQNVIDFLIIAFCIFMLIKGINVLSRKKEEAPAAPAEPGNEEKLLMEIRDLLKEQSQTDSRR